MDLKDNSYRCPWCGNIVEKAERSRYHSHSKECPYCHYDYICKIRVFPIIVMFLAPFAGLFFEGDTVYFGAFLAGYIYLCFDLSRSPMVRCKEKAMPTKGYTVKIELYSDYWKIKLKYWRIMLVNDMVIPIVFIDKSGKAVSLPCCVRIEDGKWRKGLFECDLKMLEFGEQPQNTSDRIYLYNKGNIIGSGDVVKELETSY